MFSGLTTNEDYKKCISIGLCGNHLEDLEEELVKKEDSHELQRKAFLYIRLRILDPLVFGKSYIFEKMDALISKSHYFAVSASNNEEKVEKFMEAVLLLDSIVVFTLCQFSKICCSGCLFLSNQKPKHDLNSEAEFIQKLLNNKTVSENDIRHFNPILQDNFKGHDEGLIKYCYVIVLLFVRNTTIRVRLKQALAELSADLLNDSKESAKWLEIAEEAQVRKEYIESIEAYKTALTFNSYSYQGISGRGYAYYHLGKLIHAYTDSYISAMIDPYYWKNYYVIALYLKSKNKYQDCVNIIEFGIDKCKQHESNGLIKLQNLLEYVTKKSIKNSSINSTSFEKMNGHSNTSVEDVPDLEGPDSENELEEPPSLLDASGSGKSSPEPPSLLDVSMSGKSSPDVPELSDASNSDDEDSKELKISSENNKKEKGTEKIDSKKASIERSRLNSKASAVIQSRSNSKSSDVIQSRSNSKSSDVIQSRSSSKSSDVQRSRSKSKSLDQRSRSNSKSYVAKSPVKKEELYKLLMEGTKMLLDDCGHLAVPNFLKVLEIIQTLSGNCSFDEWEIVCIKYAYGLSNCSSGSLEDLLKSITSFQEIIENHTKITFPAAYYGIGLAYQKLNRFKDALKYLKIVKDFLEKKIYFKVYTWPGLKTVINETRVEQLKGLVDCKIKECESPPSPDAICRYSDCPSQPSIYYSDPDFKGFLTLQCSEQCSVNYHAQCWKTVKNSMQLTDKEFLEKKCLTPDCDGIISRVEIINKEGNSEKVFGSLPEKKPVKLKKPKTTKKQDFKEEKKRRRHSSRESEEKVKEDEENLQISEGNNKAKNELPSTMESSVNNCDTSICDKDKSENPPKPLSANSESFIIIKKEKISHDVNSRTTSKAKELKKPKVVTLSFDEFCDTANNFSVPQNKVVNLPQKNLCSYQEEWPTCHETFGHSPSNPTFKEESLSENKSQSVEEAIEVNDEDAIKCNLYLYLEDFLTRNGPLSITDSRLVRELEMFPTEANIVIAKDGIAEFLKNDPEFRFGIVDNLYVCSRHDLAHAYNLSRMSGVVAPDTTDLLEEYIYESPNNLSLNPDAKEYQPLSMSSGLSTSTTSFVSVPEESDGRIEKTLKNSPNLISAISKLRQPLNVDAEHSKSLSETPIPYSRSDSAKTFVKESEDGNNIEMLTKDCIKAVHHYFSDKMVSQQSYILSCIKPFKIIRIPEKEHKALQTEQPQVDTESKSTMKTDDEMDKLEEVIGRLNGEKSELEVQKTLAETKLSSEMDSLIQLRKKSTVEIEFVKKEFEDLKLELESQKDEFKSKEIKLEREYKLLMESLDHVKEENKQQKREIDRLLLDKNSLQNSLKEMKEENSITKTSFEEVTQKLNESSKNMDSEKSKLITRAKNAELQLLHFKKEAFITTIDAKLVEAAQRMKEINQNLPLVPNPFYKKNLELLLINISSYAKNLADIRNTIKNEIGKQINAVKDGIELETLKPFELKNLPIIPSYAAPSNVPVNNQAPVFCSPMLNPALITPMSSAQLQNTVKPVQSSLLSNPLTIPQNTVRSIQNPLHMGTELTNPQNLQKPSTSSGQISEFPSLTQKPPPGMSAKINISEPSVPVSYQKITNAKTSTSYQSPSLSPAVSSDLSTISKGVLPQPLVQPINTEVGKAKVNTVCDSAITKSAASKADQDPLSKNCAASNISAAAKVVEKVCDKLSLELAYKVKNKSDKTESTLSLQSIVSNPKSKEPENSCNKLLRKLQSRYPQYDENRLMGFIKEFRTKRQNSLSGLAVDKIVQGVSELINAQLPPSQLQNKVEAYAKYPLPTKGLVNKKLVPDKKEPTPPPAGTQKGCPWASSRGDSKNQWDGGMLEEDCIICYEHMTYSNAYKVDCGHCFHLACIKAWLSKKSDCPICRVHLLLPEDYPALS